MSNLGLHSSASSHPPRSGLSGIDPHLQALKLVASLQDTRVALVSERARNQAIIDSLGEGLIVIDHEGKITAVNPYALKLFGFKDNELIGRWYPRAIVAVDQNVRRIPPLKRPIIKALTQGTAVSEHLYYLRKDRSVVPVHTNVAPIRLDNKPAGAIAVFRDMTREKQLDIAKDEFVSLASHQLKTPATGVKAILSMLAEGDFGQLSPIQLRYILKAAEANNRQLDIVDDLLHVAKIDSGNIQLNQKEADLAGLVRSVLAEHVSHIQKRRQRLMISTEPNVRAHIDVPKVRMVMDNLISNASKYTPSYGQIHITVRSLPANRRALIRVQDSGVGISRRDLPKLFKKFSRIDNEMSQLVGGTGLGLYLAKSIAELHGGTINVKSQPGNGTIMTMTLPARPA